MTFCPSFPILIFPFDHGLIYLLTANNLEHSQRGSSILGPSDDTFQYLNLNLKMEQETIKSINACIMMIDRLVKLEEKTITNMNQVSFVSSSKINCLVIFLLRNTYSQISEYFTIVCCSSLCKAFTRGDFFCRWQCSLKNNKRV